MKKSYIFAMVFLCMTFISCDSFFNAQSVRKEIEEAIEYNNALASTLIFRVPDSSGEFLTGTQKACKLSYTIDVQFSLTTEEFVYFGLEAKSLDGTQDRSEYVEFTDIGTSVEKANGIYKTRIKLLKQSDDISIQPVCKAIPKVLAVVPKNESTGCPQDSVIEITFNKALSESTFGNFEWLSVSMDDVPLLGNYFKAPYLKTPSTICIEPLSIEDETKLLLPPNGSVENKIITVSGKFTGAQKDKDEMALTQNFEHKYTINKKYGNYKTTTVSFSAVTDDGKTDAGTFLSSAQKACVIGYSTEIEFQLNKTDYYFNGFEAVSNSDKTTSLESLVSFSQIINQSDVEKGIYHYRVTVEALPEKENDILIRPKCLLLPAVQSYSPAFNTDGVNANNSIVITFNMPMEDASVTPKNSNFNFQNISLIYTNQANNNIDMSVYFESPYFDEEKKNLTFIPKALMLQKFITNLNRETIDIKFSFNENIFVIKDRIVLPLKQDQKSNCTIRYKASIEKTKPVKSQNALFFATKEDVSIQNAAGFSQDNKIPVGQFDDSHFADAETVYAHRVGSAVHIYGEYTDEDSGVKTVFIKERLMNDKNGTDVSSTTQFQTYSYVLTNNGNVQSVFDDAGNVKFCITHQLHSADGLVLLKVSASDACQNESEETTVTVVHDEEFGMGKINPYNTTDPNYFKGSAGSTTFIFNKTSFEQELKTLRLSSQSKEGFPETCVVRKKIYKNVYLDISKIHIKCNYQMGTEIVEESFEYNQNTHEWLCDLKAETIDGLEVNIFIDDDFGNVQTINSRFPGTPFVIYTDENYKYIGSNYSFDLIKKIEYENGTFNGTEPAVFGVINQGTADCYLFFQKDYLFGPITPQVIPGTAHYQIDNELPTIGIKEIIMKPLNNQYQFTVKLDNDSWDPGYDAIGIKYGTRNYTTKIIEKGCYEFSFIEETNKLWSNVALIQVWGIKDKKCSSITSTTYPEKPFKDEEDANSFDNVPPYFNSSSNIMDDSYQFFCSYNVNSQYYDYVKLFSLADSASGIKSLEWTINDRDAVYSGAFVNTYTYLPVWDMDESSVVLNFTATDYNNNTSSFEKTVNFLEVPQFQLRYKSSNTYELCAYSESDIWKIWRVGVYQLQEGGYWSLIEGASKNMKVLDGAEQLTTPTRDDNWYSFGDITLPPDTYIKVVTEATSYPLPNTENYGVSDTYYRYNGDLCSGEHDLFFMGVDAALIASDKPVYVETRATKRPYEECKLWTYEDWNRRTRKHLGDELFIFDDTNYSPQKYYIALDDRMSEYVAVGECYVVIAHFADGDEPRYSSVMIRER